MRSAGARTRPVLVLPSSQASGGRDRWTPPLPAPPADREAAVWELLREVLDPEIPISVVDLGLVYGVRVREDHVEVRLTFTATACPCMDFIREDIEDRLLRESWLSGVTIVEVWDPPWTTERLTAGAREELRRLGVAP